MLANSIYRFYLEYSILVSDISCMQVMANIEWRLGLTTSYQCGHNSKLSWDS